MPPNSTIYSWNVHGLIPSRLSALQLFAHEQSPLALGLLETRLNPNSSPPKLHGFSAFVKSVSRASCGALLFVANHRHGSVISRRRADLEHSQHCITVEIRLPRSPLPFSFHLFTTTVLTQQSLRRIGLT